MTHVFLRAWRPALGWALVGVVVINGIVLPVLTRQAADLGALITAVMGAIPLIAARHREKMAGLA